MLGLFFHGEDIFVLLFLWAVVIAGVLAAAIYGITRMYRRRK